MTESGRLKVLEQCVEMGEEKGRGGTSSQGVGEKREEDDYIDQGISTLYLVYLIHQSSYILFKSMTHTCCPAL